MTRSAPKNKPSRSAIRLGFVPLVDAAPLIVAHEYGFFREAGLEVRLAREPGWATVRDKLAYGRELDGAHAPAGLAFAMSYGLGCVPRHCVTGFVINRHGNGVTISGELHAAGVAAPADLPAFVKAPNARRLRFGIVHRASSHHFLLHSLLGRAGLRIGEHADIVVLPPELMPKMLAAGEIDGFCCGEPWNSAAIALAGGYCLATSADLCRGHPEKVLLVPAEFEAARPAEHRALIAALAKAGAACDDRANRPAIVDLLASSAYLDAPPEWIANSLVGPFHRGHGKSLADDELHTFSGREVNRPSSEKVDLVVGQLRDCGLLPGSPRRSPAPAEIFLAPVYDAALGASPNRRARSQRPQRPASLTPIPYR